MWPSIPNELERFTTTKKFRYLDLKIFDSILKAENDVPMASQSSHNQPKDDKGKRQLLFDNFMYSYVIVIPFASIF